MEKLKHSIGEILIVGFNHDTVSITLFEVVVASESRIKSLACSNTDTKAACPSRCNQPLNYASGGQQQHRRYYVSSYGISIRVEGNHSRACRCTDVAANSVCRQCAATYCIRIEILAVEMSWRLMCAADGRARAFSITNYTSTTGTT